VEHGPRPGRLHHHHIRMDVNLSNAENPQDAGVPGATRVYVCQFPLELSNADGMHTLPSP
jgi:hypothetical protein